MMSLNDESWVLASVAIISGKEGIEPYSTKQLRDILFCLKKKGIEPCLKECMDYQPSGVLNLELKKRKNEDFLQKLAELCKGKLQENQVKLMRMTFLNINNIDNIAKMKDRGMIELLLSAEGVSKEVAGLIIPVFRPHTRVQRSNYNTEGRFNRYSNWRK